MNENYENSSVINKIWNILKPSHRVFRIGFFNDKVLALYLYETEFPITIDLVAGKVSFDTECTNFRIDVEMMEEVLEVMKVLKDGLDEIIGWVEDTHN